MKSLDKERRYILIGFIFLFSIFGYSMYQTQVVPFCVQYISSASDYEEISNINNTSYNLNLLQKIDTELENKGYFVFNTRGNSMYPTIKTNSVCVCDAKTTYSEGDIVVYFLKDKDIIQAIGHRVIFTEEDTYIVKGDNNEVPDLPVKRAQIKCAIPQIPRKYIPNHPLEVVQ